MTLDKHNRPESPRHRTVLGIMLLSLLLAGIAACRGSDPEIGTDELEAMGISRQALLEVVRTGDTVRLSELLAEHPQLVHWRDDDMGRTLLHHAADAQQIQSMQVLLEHGADRYARDDFEDIPEDYLPGGIR